MYVHRYMRIVRLSLSNYKDVKFFFLISNFAKDYVLVLVSKRTKKKYCDKCVIYATIANKYYSAVFLNDPALYKCYTGQYPKCTKLA